MGRRCQVVKFDAATRTFSGTPGNDEVGSLSVRVIAMDGSSAAAHSDFTLTINNTMMPDGGPCDTNQSVNEDSALNFQVRAIRSVMWM